MSEKPCNGICLTGYDIGLPSSEVAYAHPTCPAHGDYPDHPFELTETDGHGHELCHCGGVRATHWEEEPCAHLVFRNGHCFDCGLQQANVLVGTLAPFARGDGQP